MEPWMLTQLGERIQGLRGRLSRSDFAAHFGVSQSSLVRWEKGERAPDLEFLSNVAQYYNVTVDWLLYGDSAQNGKTANNSKRSAPSATQQTEITDSHTKSERPFANVSRADGSAAAMLRKEVEQLNQDIARLFADKREMAKDLREALLDIDDKAALIDSQRQKLNEQAAEIGRLKAQPETQNAFHGDVGAQVQGQASFGDVVVGKGGKKS